MSQSQRPNELTLILLLGMLAAFGPLAIDMYLPAFPAIAKDLGAPSAQVGWTLAIYFAGLYFYRHSIKFRVTTSNIETERGILSKKIDVLELWRCRDVRYKQTIVDRVLGIAHIEVFTSDVTTPHIEITGLPASRQLFEQIRDSIELQRQHKNVYGVVS